MSDGSFKLDALPEWTVKPWEHGYFVVVNEQGLEITLPMSENGARLIAGAPKLLKFIGLIASSTALPAQIPASALLQRLGLEVE